ncbi:hypothetical protein OCU04_011502 [Sclerotinia nivalis]|uniref:Uncharacterized protein n=1 Tax=Sclerotinia nivalis TaxID=352851 RepID=A0A9X0ACW3_9HELO|nr:hypothetical protein OCU04_011502 [Sclerotinia nivalis]
MAGYLVFLAFNPTQSHPTYTKSTKHSFLLPPKKITKEKKHTTVGIRWWSPTQLLIYRSEACVWQSGRDAQFSSVYGRMWWRVRNWISYWGGEGVLCCVVMRGGEVVVVRLW